MNPASSLVNRLWRLCTILRKDGITYQQYVTELTYLLFLKMVHERKEEDGRIRQGYRWSNLLKAEGPARLRLYQKILRHLGDSAKDKVIRAIFDGSSTFIREHANLDALITAIDDLEWFSKERDAFGDLYEGLLQKNAEETKRGAGQYFTPRVLIDTIVELMKPEAGEIIQDPAAGTGGFLISANLAIRERTNNFHSFQKAKRDFQFDGALRGLENVPATYKLLLMNLYLHGIGGKYVELGDTLSPAGEAYPFRNAHLILTNPPFGPAGGTPTRRDLTITKSVSSYQLPFVEHCIQALRDKGRAAVVVPDNVLFEVGHGRNLRTYLMEQCNLHTILRLPVGIFYAQGVKTNVLFFQRGLKTKKVWIFDLRTNMPAFGKTNAISDNAFNEFIKCFGNDPNGGSKRRDQGETGRFRCFTREEIAKRNDTLDISWLRDMAIEIESKLSDPEDIAAAIVGHLKAAQVEFEAIGAEMAKSAE